MSTEQKNNQIVFTNKAKCRDCYRCIRVCPVKAIGLRDGQAYVDETKCISCGTCIRECPQHAKSFRNDLDRVIGLIGSARKIAVTIAPSFSSFFEKWQIKRLPSVLRKLGFSYISETAVGAYFVAKETSEYIKNNPSKVHIIAACPAVVNYIELYKPELIKHLVPIASPMIAHGRMIKGKLGDDAAIVFIGPCVAKKSEVQYAKGEIDYALTFLELQQWFERENLNLDEFEESDFDEIPQGWARNFPLAGGALQTGLLSTDMLNENVISVSGFEEIDDILKEIDNHSEPVIIEPLFCEQGCINGPAAYAEDNIFRRRKAVLDYTSKNYKEEKTQSNKVDLTVTFKDKYIDDEGQITESEMTRILSMTGKESPEDQLNCGACGYSTCRQQAIAVIKGMAEADMCIPYMRRLAERRTDKIIDTSPNGIVILDEHLKIISMNNSFKALFMCSEAVCGKKLSYLMDPEPFYQLISGQQEMTEMTVEHSKYNLICHQIIYAIREENQFVGIFVNMTNSLKNQKQLDEIKAKTVMQAQSLLTHQIDIASRIAQYLGESTSESEKLLENLMELGQEKSKHSGEGNSPWIKTYT